MDEIVSGAAGTQDGPWELPEGWCWAPLACVAEVNPKTDFASAEAHTPIPFIPMAAVSEETGAIDTSTRRPLAEVVKGYVRFADGDVIFAKITPCMENGKVAPVIGLGGAIAAGSTEFHVFRPRHMDQRYLWLWLVSRSFRQKAKRNMSGSAGQLRVPVDWLREAEIPVPPLAEQKRIVARIDTLFAEIADGEAALNEARKNLETFRRALLKAAVTGDLTKDWRASNKPEEMGREVLARIRAERSDALAARGKRQAAIGATAREVADLPIIPRSWVWGVAGDLIEVIEAGLNVAAEGRPPAPKEVGIVKVSAVTWGEFDEDASKTLPKDAPIKAANLIKVGDFLFSRANTLELVGAPVIVKSLSRRLVLSDKVLRFRVRTGMDVWLELVLKSPLGRREIQARATGAQLSMRNISQDAIRTIPVPIPPPEETVEILRRVTHALTAASDTLASLDAEAADAARLRQSVLKAGFEGRLVPQDPADEPARALLARLQKEPVDGNKRRRTHAR